MQNIKEAKVSQLVDIAVRNQNLVYVCLRCQISYSRSDHLVKHTDESHGFRIVGLPKIPTGDTKEALDTFHLQMATGGLVGGKRRKMCTLSTPAHSSKKSPALGAHDVILARASSSSEAIADDQPSLPSLSNAVLEHYLERGYSPVSPPALLEEGSGVEGAIDGNVGAEPPGTVAGTSSGAAMLEAEVDYPNAAPRREATASQEPVLPTATVTRGSYNRPTNLEVVSENIMSILVSVQPPWHATQVLELVAAEYPQFEKDQLLGLVRSCIRAAKTVSHKIRVNALLSGGSWKYADDIDASMM